MPDLWNGVPLEELVKQNEQLGDAEYEIAVANEGGPLVEEAVDADQQNTLLYNDPEKNTTLLGTAFPDDARRDYQSSTPEEKDKWLKEGYDWSRLAYSDSINLRTGTKTDMLGVLSKALEADRPTVITYGAKNAAPLVQSHEFRHVAITKIKELPEAGLDKEKSKALRSLKGVLPGESQEEGWNRRFDAYRSDDPDAHIFMIRQRWLSRGKPGSSLVDEWDRWKTAHFDSIRVFADEYAGVEANIRTLRGDKPPKGTSWRTYYKKLYNERHDTVLRKIDKRF